MPGGRRCSSPLMSPPSEQTCPAWLVHPCSGFGHPLAAERPIGHPGARCTDGCGARCRARLSLAESKWVQLVHPVQHQQAGYPSTTSCLAASAPCLAGLLINSYAMYISIGYSSRVGCWRLWDTTNEVGATCCRLLGPLAALLPATAVSLKLDAFTTRLRPHDRVDENPSSSNQSHRREAGTGTQSVPPVLPLSCP